MVDYLHIEDGKSCIMFNHKTNISYANNSLAVINYFAVMIKGQWN